ncbi:MAG: Fic family protein [Ferruginibacter sp.]
MQHSALNISAFNSGSFRQQTGYKSFVPEAINRQWNIDIPELSQLLSEADRKLGELNAFGELVPDIDFFIKMHITKEATNSSRIEGTQTNMEEAFVRKENLEPEKRNDWDEVHNYIEAINYSIERLKQLPVSTRLIKETHGCLLNGVRGEHKLPGQYRSSQNWIGATLKDAVFIPPHHSELDNLLSDLENFIHNENIAVPHLIKAGILHYQFETIHPFLDGNGRMGRLLLTLYLVSNGLLQKPTLYLSEFFEQNRSYYYDYLHRVRTHNDMLQWLKFFLAGVIETAQHSIQTFRSIIKLKEKVEGEKIIQLGTRKMEKAKRLIKQLYQNPITTTVQLKEDLGMETTAASRLVNDFVGLGILVEMTGFKRNRMFVFKEYLDIFNNKP